ncbi:sugar ABC transporter permease [Anaerolineae bacterium CFX9]|nr:sugar ABC transporter permease [Anaerolineae bacterium CFX9]
MHNSRDRWIAIGMLTPSVILVAIFVYGFIGSTALTSLTNSNAMQRLSRQPADYIGLRNYVDLFTGALDTRFRTDFVNTIFFTAIFIVVCLVLGALLAILLDQKVKGEGLFRTIFLFPMALSFVVTGVVWKWLFNPGAGINILPTAIGLPAGEFRWFIAEQRILTFHWQDLPTIIATVVLAAAAAAAIWFYVKRQSRAALFGLAIVILMSALIFTGITAQILPMARTETYGFNLALISVVVAAGWQMSGYTMAMYLAGLRGVPEELREAARVDGCNEIAVYRRIVFPLLAPITLSAIIILGHISLKIFDLVYVLGGGDNLYIDMPGLNMFFETFRGQNFGRGAAIAIVMLIMVAVVIVPYLYSNFRAEEKRS